MDNSGKENVESKITPGIKKSEILYAIKRERKQIIGREKREETQTKSIEYIFKKIIEHFPN